MEDVAYAEDWGGVIKLIGRAKKLQDGKLTAGVFPAFIGEHSQLANIDDVFNGVLIRGDATGDVVFYGRGAGKFPTASAVVADMIDVAKANTTSKSLSWEDSAENHVVDIQTVPFSFYLRFCSERGDESEAQLRELFPDSTWLARKKQPENEWAFITPVMTGLELQERLARLDEADQLLNRIRLLDY